MSPEIPITPTAPAASNRRRWRLRFGLRGLIVMVTLAAIVFAPLGMIARRKQREQRAIDTLTSVGAIVSLFPPRSATEYFSQYARGGPWFVHFGAFETTGRTDPNYPYRLPSVTRLPSSHADLCDAQMPKVLDAIRELGPVRQLVIESLTLTDDGIIQLLSGPNLEHLDLRCPLVTSRGTDALQRKFPKLVILDD